MHRAALAGVSKAQYSLAHCYHDGFGVAKSPAQAVAWLRRAADAGDVSAQVFLASWYRSGDGVEKSLATAIMWLRRAAAAALPESKVAQYQLAGMLGEGGEGVVVDLAEAFALLVLSAEAGFVDAQIRVAECYQWGTGVAVDAAKAAAWRRRARAGGGAM